MSLIERIVEWALGEDASEALDAVGSAAQTQFWDRFGGGF